MTECLGRLSPVHHQEERKERYGSGAAISQMSRGRAGGSSARAKLIRARAGQGTAGRKENDTRAGQNTAEHGQGTTDMCSAGAGSCSVHQYLEASNRTWCTLRTVRSTGSNTVATESCTNRRKPNSGETKLLWKPSASLHTCTMQSATQKEVAYNCVAMMLPCSSSECACSIHHFA